MINHVTLQGNLARDPEIRHLPNGTAVCETTIAHNKKWTTESGEKKEVVAFIAVTIWGKKGEAFAQYHKKGDQALIKGELAQEKWDDKTTGQKRERTKVNVTDWHFCGGQKQGAALAPQRAAAPATTAPAGRSSKAATATPPAVDPSEDVPF